MRQITFAPTCSGWQRAARRALADEYRPEEIVWEELGDEQPALGMFDESEDAAAEPARTFRVPKAFLEMAQRVACHRDGGRWALLYRLLWRLTHSESRLLEIVVDPDVNDAMRMEKAVRRDVHKMRAFVRFRQVGAGEAQWYVAWFEPEHHIVELNAPFFVDRFASMRWSILTPLRCVHWDGAQVSFTAGVSKSEAPTEDAVEKLWLTYYSHIFNPARVKPERMAAEMPKRYWKNLPEAAVIPVLLNEAPARVERMFAQSEAQQNDVSEWRLAAAPATDDLGVLRSAAAACTACPLYKRATQTVFGEGDPRSPLVLVGEQPGDSEDLQGRPFVGPAGQLLDRALVEAGIDRSSAYVTNAVKHFKWEPRGKRRLHQTPTSRDIASCRPWLEAELRTIAPKVLVCLGGTAAKAILGPAARVMRDRGQTFSSPFCERTLVTVHPSSLLRAPDESMKAANYALFVQDLQTAARLLLDPGA